MGYAICVMRFPRRGPAVRHPYPVSHIPSRVLQRSANRAPEINLDQLALVSGGAVRVADDARLRNGRITGPLQGRVVGALPTQCALGFRETLRRIGRRADDEAGLAHRIP